MVRNVLQSWTRVGRPRPTRILHAKLVSQAIVSYPPLVLFFLGVKANDLQISKMARKWPLWNKMYIRWVIFFRLYVPEVMRSLSGHWSTGQPLETDLVNKLCTVPRHLLAGYDLCRQLFFADFDISFYSVDWEKEGYQEMVTRLRSDYLLLPKLSR